jgi:two-component system, NtrC family, response regulator HydG
VSDKLKVLVVDDDRQMVKTICDILQVKGYEAVPAHSGEEAIDKVRNDAPDCVLMDIKMPGIDGVEVLKMIKDISPDTPVVLMSAYATDEQVEEAKLYGAATVLTKPLDFQKILSFFSLLKKESNVLIVDHDPEFSKMLKDILQMNGYHAQTEEDPEMVLGHMEQQYQLVVILGLNLDNSDSLEVLKQVRDRYPEKPVMLMASDWDRSSDTIEQGLREGAYSCLEKTFALEKLMPIIKDIQKRKSNVLLGEPF